MKQRIEEAIEEILEAWRTPDHPDVATTTDIVRRWGPEVLAADQPADECLVELADGTQLDYHEGRIRRGYGRL